MYFLCTWTMTCAISSVDRNRQFKSGVERPASILYISIQYVQGISYAFQARGDYAMTSIDERFEIGNVPSRNMSTHRYTVDGIKQICPDIISILYLFYLLYLSLFIHVFRKLCVCFLYLYYLLIPFFFFESYY